MREDDLPSPGVVGGGSELRRTAARVISYVDVNKLSSGFQSEAPKLKAFFDACSGALDDFIQAAPTNSVAPAITGTAQVGETLTVSNGTWANSPTFTRQWKADAVAISGATGTTYVPVEDDIGAVITCTVTGTNLGGSLAVTSAATDAVIAA